MNIRINSKEGQEKKYTSEVNKRYNKRDGGSRKLRWVLTNTKTEQRYWPARQEEQEEQEGRRT